MSMGEDSRKKELLNKLRSNLELLSSPLEYATKVLGLAHYGDEETKKMCLLSIVTAWLPSRYHISCAITGPTMTGKTNLLHALFELVPRSRMLDKAILLRMTPMSLFYEAANRGEKIEKKGIRRYVFDAGRFIVFLGDFALFYREWNKGLRSKEWFRYLFSVEDKRILCHGRKTQYCIKGRPVFISTLLDEDVHLLKGQELGRLLMAWVDINRTPEDEKRIFEFILNMDEEHEKQFEHSARLVRSFLSFLPNVMIVKLSRDAIKFLEESIASLPNKGDAEVIALRLVSLSASYELLKYTASLIREEKEVPEKLDELEVTEKSVRYIWNIGRDTIMMG
jgi:hypothetical protein